MSWHQVNSARRVGVLPLQWLGIFVVLADVVHEFLARSLTEVKMPSADLVALDSREPVLHLVEPQRVGQRVVNLQLG